MEDQKTHAAADKSVSIEAETGEAPGWMHKVSKTSNKIAPSNIIPAKILPIFKYLFNSRPLIYLGMFLAVFVYGIDHDLGIANSLMWALGYAIVTLIILELANFVIFKTGPMRKLLIQKIPGVKKEENNTSSDQEKTQAKDNKTDDKKDKINKNLGEDKKTDEENSPTPSDQKSTEKTASETSE